MVHFSSASLPRSDAVSVLFFFFFPLHQSGQCFIERHQTRLLIMRQESKRRRRRRRSWQGSRPAQRGPRLKVAQHLCHVGLS